MIGNLQMSTFLKIVWSEINTITHQQITPV